MTEEFNFGTLQEYVLQCSSHSWFVADSIKVNASPHWPQVLTLLGLQVFFFSCAMHLKFSTTNLRSCLCTIKSKSLLKTYLMSQLFGDQSFCVSFSFVLVLFFSAPWTPSQHYKSLLLFTLFINEMFSLNGLTTEFPKCTMSDWSVSGEVEQLNKIKQKNNTFVLSL